MIKKITTKICMYLILTTGLLAWTDVKASLRYDVNQDGVVSASDALLTLRKSLGLDLSNSAWQTVEITGDADCDNSTDSTDAMLILRYSLGLDIGENRLIQLENEVKSDLDNLQTDTDFSLKIISDKGDIFTHSTGESSEFKVYRSASASKLVSASIILSIVKDGVLSLDDFPQDYIANWPTSGNLSTIKLRHLLNFSSGLTEEPLCANLPNYNFEDCVERVIVKNDDSKLTAEEFYYSGAHLQVAGLMAIKAGGFSSWQELFNHFKSETFLFPSSEYDLPSLENPRLAGGLHYNAKEYVDFLEALYRGEILNNELISQMTNDQLGDASIGNSPAFAAIGEDWHYGFGNWIECHSSQYNCTETTRISSPGIYGAYPFIDYEYGYFGIVAREGALGTFRDGYNVFMSVSEKLEEWASMQCN